MTQIRNIGSTIEPIDSRERENYPADYDCFVVMFADVKMDQWRDFHKLVVKVPVIRRELTEANKQGVVNVAMEKMRKTLQEAKQEPD